jgi:hypothetical protein
VLAGAAVRGGGTGPAPVPPASAPASPAPSATGGGSAAPSGSPSSAPGTSSSGPATPTQVSLAAMLRNADAGPGEWTVTEEYSGDWLAYFALGLCAKSFDFPFIDSIHQRERSFSRGETAAVYQRARAFAPGSAVDHLAALKAAVTACGTFNSRITGDRITVRITQDGFAGATADESFLVEVNSGGGVSWQAFVRRGALVTDVVVSPNTLAETLRVGQAAANRLAQAGG